MYFSWFKITSYHHIFFILHHLSFSSSGWFVKISKMKSTFYLICIIGTFVIFVDYQKPLYAYPIKPAKVLEKKENNFITTHRQNHRFSNEFFHGKLFFFFHFGLTLWIFIDMSVSSNRFFVLNCIWGVYNKIKCNLIIFITYFWIKF